MANITDISFTVKKLFQYCDLEQFQQKRMIKCLKNIKKASFLNHLASFIEKNRQIEFTHAFFQLPSFHARNIGSH